jgi:hypothetical protein
MNEHSNSFNYSPRLFCKICWCCLGYAPMILYVEFANVVFIILLLRVFFVANFRHLVTKKKG